MINFKYTMYIDRYSANFHSNHVREGEQNTLVLTFLQLARNSEAY